MALLAIDGVLCQKRHAEELAQITTLEKGTNLPKPGVRRTRHEVMMESESTWDFRILMLTPSKEKRTEDKE